MISDEAFNEAYKPLQIPSAYRVEDSWHDKVIFALATLGSGTVEDVIEKLVELDSSLDHAAVMECAENILTALFDKGLIKGYQAAHGMTYDLSKILVPNSGSTSPDLKN